MAMPAVLEGCPTQGFDSANSPGGGTRTAKEHSAYGAYFARGALESKLSRPRVNCTIGERPDVFPWTESTKDSVPK
jgi:hypothetical protein